MHKTTKAKVEALLAEKKLALETTDWNSIDHPILEQEIADCEFALENHNSRYELNNVREHTTSRRLCDLMQEALNQ